MKKYVVIVAGGTGIRMSSSIPKQFVELAGLPVMMHAINAFYNYDKEIKIIIAIHNSYREYWSELIKMHSFVVEHQVVSGGKTRFHSVKNAIDTITENGLVAIHDAARPLVSYDTLYNCFKLAGEKGNAVPVVDIAQSIRKVDQQKSESADRTKYKIVQTPQVFNALELKKAYEQSYKDSFTDDATVMEADGHSIFLSKGNPENIKITTFVDLHLANTILTKQKP